MADKTEVLAQLRTQRAGRGSSAKQRLLDDADNNIGNGQIVDPATLAPTIIVQTNPPRLLKLDAMSPTGQMVTVGLTNRYSLSGGDNFLASGLGGPMVGIIEFGNGNAFSRVEVDIPLGRTFLSNNVTALSDGQDGITCVTVPAGTLRVYARNDGMLIPTTFLGEPVGTGLGIPPSTCWNSLVTKGTFVQAFSNYFSRFSTFPNTRSQLFYQTPGGAGPQVLPVAGTAIATRWVAIPPYAKAVRYLRNPITADGTIYFFDQNFLLIDQATVAAGATSPIIQVPTNAAFFYISTTVGVNTAIAEFQVGV